MIKSSTKLFAVILSGLHAVGASPPADDKPIKQAIWLDNLDLANDKAKNDKKHILLYFSGSDWCRPCIQLKEKVFTSKNFNQFAEKNLILVQLDFPAQKKNQLADAQRAHNAKMAEIHNPKGVFPLVVIINSEERKSAIWGVSTGRG